MRDYAYFTKAAATLTALAAATMPAGAAHAQGNADGKIQSGAGDRRAARMAG
jgi:hypothetical protein